MILDVLQFPDPRLREKALSICKDEVDYELQQLARNMGETMYDEPGIGLAATQVGVAKRLIVLDVHWSSEGERNLQVVLNPVIVEAEGKVTSEGEACLSVPDYSADVERSERVVVRGRNLEWEEVEYKVDGIEAVCFQHEIDHLDGILFIDRISKLKRDLYIRRRKKQLKREREEREGASL